MDPSVLGKAAVTFTVFVGIMDVNQEAVCRAFEAHVELDELRRQVSVAAAERIELERGIQVLESRTRVVPAATDRLGMHMPDASEQIILASGPES